MIRVVGWGGGTTCAKAQPWERAWNTRLRKGISEAGYRRGGGRGVEKAKSAIDVTTAPVALLCFLEAKLPEDRCLWPYEFVNHEGNKTFYAAFKLFIVTFSSIFFLKAAVENENLSFHNTVSPNVYKTKV